jgi:hypothetical protein
MKCRNCQKEIPADSKYCPYCGFENKPQMTRREDYHNDSRQTNSTIAAMIAWLHNNTTIVFFSGVGLMILVSFSRPLGWFTFFALLIWLFIVCEKSGADTNQYTADKRLTEDVSNLSSRVVNNMENDKARIQQRRHRGEEPVERVHKKRTGIQVALLLMALFSLLVLFFGPFASYSTLGLNSDASIARSLISIGGRGGSYIVTGYGLLLLLICAPCLIIWLTLKDGHQYRWLIFTISMIETVLLVYIAFKLIMMDQGANIGSGAATVSGTGRLNQITTNAISFGISSYLMFLASVITSFLAGKNLKQ